MLGHSTLHTVAIFINGDVTSGFAMYTSLGQRRFWGSGKHGRQQQEDGTLFKQSTLPGLAELLDDANAQQVQDASLRVRHFAARNAGADLLLRRRRGGFCCGRNRGKRLHTLHTSKRVVAVTADAVRALD